MTNRIDLDRADDATLYVIAACRYSREGLEGIVGYDIGRAYVRRRDAEYAIEQDVRKRHQSRGDLELVWEPARDDDTHTLVLHCYYQSHQEIAPGQYALPNGLLVQHYGTTQKLRTDTYEEWTVLEIQVDHVSGFIEREHFA